MVFELLSGTPPFEVEDPKEVGCKFCMGCACHMGCMGHMGCIGCGCHMRHGARARGHMAHGAGCVAGYVAEGIVGCALCMGLGACTCTAHATSRAVCLFPLPIHAACLFLHADRSPHPGSKARSLPPRPLPRVLRLLAAYSVKEGCGAPLCEDAAGPCMAQGGPYT